MPTQGVCEPTSIEDSLRMPGKSIRANCPVPSGQLRVLSYSLHEFCRGVTSLILQVFHPTLIRALRLQARIVSLLKS